LQKRISDIGEHKGDLAKSDWGQEEMESSH
jgi:hypothetical protein